MTPANRPPSARDVWSRTTLHVWPERYVLVSLPLSALADAAALAGHAKGFVALVRERDEVSLSLDENAWRLSSLRSRAIGEAGPYRAITLDVNIDLGVVGYLAPLAERLAAAGVSIVPQCAYLKDHLLVREVDLETARAAVEAFIVECRGPE